MTTLSKLTKAELVKIIQARDAELEALRVELAQLKATPQTTAVLPNGQRVARKVYEFNPAIKGDFLRASALARENNGIVKRAAR